MKKMIIAFFSLITSANMYSQIEFEGNNLIVTSESEGKLTIEKYTKDFIIKRNNECDFENEVYEEKLCQSFNLRTQEELKKFFSPNEIPKIYKKEDYLKKMLIYDDYKNYYKLDSKYIFDNSLNKEVFIKYINYNEVFPKPVYSVFYIQQNSHDLMVKDMGENFDLGFFLLGTSTDKTIDYLSNLKFDKVDITSLCTDFLGNIKDPSKKNKLFSLTDEEYSPFYNEESQKKLKKDFLTKKIQINYKKTYHDKISGVVLKKIDISKNEFSEKYRIPLNMIKKDSVSVKEVIKVNVLNNDYTIIKFYGVDAPVIKTDFDFLNMDLAKKSIVLSVLLKINFEAFVNFYSNETNKKFPEVVALRPSVKDSDGALNINKLGEIIEKNKVKLAKYLDE